MLFSIIPCRLKSLSAFVFIKIWSTPFVPSCCRPSLGGSLLNNRYSRGLEMNTLVHSYIEKGIFFCVVSKIDGNNCIYIRIQFKNSNSRRGMRNSSGIKISFSVLINPSTRWCSVALNLLSLDGVTFRCRSTQV